MESPIATVADQKLIFLGRSLANSAELAFVAEPRKSINLKIFWGGIEENLNCHTRGLKRGGSLHFAWKHLSHFLQIKKSSVFVLLD